MAGAALDASALIALIRDETGGHAVRRVLRGSVASAVNWSEVAKRLLEIDRDPRAVRAIYEGSGMRILPFDARDAQATAVLGAPTRHLGLSLADRSCLALALRLGVPAYTADRRWADLDLGIEVVVIR